MCVYVKGQPFIPAPNCARTRMVYDYLGQQVENVVYFQKGSPFDAASLAALNAEIHTAWNTTIKLHQQTGLAFLFVESTALDAAAGAQDTLAIAGNGVIAGPGYPGSVTIAIKFATGTSGRSSRGRYYWPGIAESQATGNLLNTAVATAFVADLQAFFATIEAALTVDHVVVSYCNNNVWRTTAVATKVLNYLLVDSALDNQRRRLAGRGI